MSSNSGLLAYRDLDHALGLFDSVSAVFIDKRTGRNIQHAMSTLLRQSIYSRLTVNDDVNDAELLPGGKRLLVLAYNLGNFFKTVGSSKDNKTLVASQPTRKTNQNRSEDCQAQQIHYIPDG